MNIIKICEHCGSEFETANNVHGQRKRFCNTSCSAKWRMKTYGAVKVSERGKQNQRESMKRNWQKVEFRQRNYERMTTNNPVYMKGVIEKANKTRLAHGPYPNNFKYGNGKISAYEQRVYSVLTELGFYYNYAIATKVYRDAFIGVRVPTSYKSDFTNLITKVCIEIDGDNHQDRKQKELDNKKDECLKYLGFKVIRFTHQQIDSGEFEKWLNSYPENL